MSYMNANDFNLSDEVRVLSLGEIDAVAGAGWTVEEAQAAGNALMAAGAVTGGLGAVSGAAPLMVGGAILGIAGGTIYLTASAYAWYYGS